MSERERQQSQRSLSKTYTWVAFALAAIAGAVDGIGYIILAHIFTSHMSGNTVALMLHVASGNWREAWRHFEPIVAFFCGVLFGLGATDALVQTKLARTFGAIAVTEIVLLVAFFLVAHPAEQWMVVLPAGAMGIQNAMLRRVGHHSVRTTYMTGMLTSCAQGLVEAVAAKIGKDEAAPEKFKDFLLYGGIWLAFAIGGIIGALLQLRHGSVSLFLPIGGLAALILYDIFDPVSKPEPEKAGDRSDDANSQREAG